MRFNLGIGEFIKNTARIFARIKNKDPKPDILSVPKVYEVFVSINIKNNKKIKSTINEMLKNEKLRILIL